MTAGYVGLFKAIIENTRDGIMTVNR